MERSETPLMNDRGENQHILPKFYLRRFACKRPKNHIFCFDKVTSEVSLVPIKKAASAPNYYETIDAEGNALLMEDALSKVESYFSTALDAVRSNPTARTLRANKADLSEFLACQAHRTEVMRNKVRQLLADDAIEQQNNVTNDAVEVTEAVGLRKIREDSDNNEKTEGLGKDQEGWSGSYTHTAAVEVVDQEAHVRHTHVGLIAIATPELARTLFRMRWRLLHNVTQGPFTPFWTSDYPFCIVEGDNRSNMVVFAPLTPRLTVMLSDPKYHPILPDDMQADSSWVELINTGMVREALQHIYSPDDNFELANQILQEHPDVADLHRQRHAVLGIEETGG